MRAEFDHAVLNTDVQVQHKHVHTQIHCISIKLMLKMCQIKSRIPRQTHTYKIQEFLHEKNNVVNLFNLKNNLCQHEITRMHHQRTHTLPGCNSAHYWFTFHLLFMIQHTPQVKWRRTQTGSLWEVGRQETQHRSLCINLDTLTHTCTSLVDGYQEFIHLSLVFTSPSLPHSSSSRTPLCLHSSTHSKPAGVLPFPSSSLILHL